VDEKLIRIEEKEQLTLDPEFYKDVKQAAGVMKFIKLNKKWVADFMLVETAVEDVDVMVEFLKEGEVTEKEVDDAYAKAEQAYEELAFKSTLNRPEDELGVILEINAGAGGTESNDWAEMLYRMYVRWAEKEGHKVSLLNFQKGDTVGIKSVELSIEGDYVYGVLKGENGVHRLVRVSPFNAQGKRMTSFASVFVHPLVDDTIEVKINPADLSWDTFRASGAGGQHVNKTESAVRVTHAPTGVVVECQEERSQHMNREKALVALKSRLYEIELEKQRAERDEIESGKTKNEWGSQIRSYVLDDRRVKDHRTNYQTSQTEAVLDGDIDEFLKSYLMWVKN